MNSFENRLAAAGLRPARPPAECWRVERLGAPRRLPGKWDANPAQRRILSIWLGRLSERNEPAAYRIRRVGDSD
jgi:hypothetical protein